MNKMLYKMLMALGIIAAQILFTTVVDKPGRDHYEQ